MDISYNAHNRCTQGAFLIVSNVDVNMFPALRNIPVGTTDINLRSCILNRQTLRQSQIATNQESLPSQFVICRNLWSRPWRHKLSPITLKTCSGYLGKYPCSLLAWIWKVAFLPILVLFHWHFCLCVYISYNAHKRCNKETFLKWSDVYVNVFSVLGTLGHYWHQFEKLYFEPSQIATVTNCDKSGIPALAICDLWQFMIKAVTAQTDSNNTDNVFRVHGRVPMFIFDRNLRSYIKTHFRIICHIYCI